MSQDSTCTSLYSDLFFDENFDDYEPISIETVREEASKCKDLLTNTDNDESDISIDIDFTESSDSDFDEESTNQPELSTNDQWTKNAKHMSLVGHLNQP